MIDVVDIDKDITEDDNVDVASAQPGFVKDQVWRLTKLETSKILSKRGIVEPLTIQRRYKAYDRLLCEEDQQRS